MTFYFVYIRCPNGHVMIGANYPIRGPADVECARALFQELRDEGTRSGAFKGRCGRYGNADLSIDQLDTGTAVESEANAWARRKIEEWRTDRLN